MSWDNRVLWSEGTFLQPQHLQQHDRFQETYVELRARALRPYSWGFAELVLDESLLELGKVAVQAARGVMPDGTPFECPGRDPLPPPLDVPASLRESLVSLALPIRRPGVDEADLGRRPEVFRIFYRRPWDAPGQVPSRALSVTLMPTISATVNGEQTSGRSNSVFLANS